jgi:hypothetical protein
MPTPRTHTVLDACTDGRPTGRYRAMSATQVLLAQAALLEQWALEDAARRARNAAILASL